MIERVSSEIPLSRNSRMVFSIQRNHFQYKLIYGPIIYAHQRAS